MSALDTVVKALNTLCPPRPLTVHLLQSEPRRTNTLYTHLAAHPKGTTIQDVLLVLYIHLEPADLSSSPSPITAADDDAASQSCATKSGVEHTTTSSTNPIALISIQAQIFILPREAHTMVYISKADSTGYTLPSSLPSRPYARTIISSFLSYYLCPQSRPTPTVQVHLFARSQRQYLFPDSGLDPEETEGKIKKILSGGALCRWWSDVLERSIKLAGLGPSEVDLECFLPGLSKGETLNTLGRRTEFTWSTDLKNVPHPLHNQAPNPSSVIPTLASTIPTFDDDPRTRFLLELSTPGAGTGSSSLLSSNSALPSLPSASASSITSSSTTPNASGQPKNAMDKDEGEDNDDEEVSNKALAARTIASARLSTIPQDEFYERLAFRQECSLGSQVGFFILSTLSSSPLPSTSASATLVFTPISVPTTMESHTQPKRRPGELPKNLFIRLLSMLLNQSFSSNPLVISSSKIIWDSIRGLTGEWGALEYVERSIESSSSLTTDDETNSKRKRSDADGDSALVGRDVSKGTLQPVTVLQVRKKKKKADS
ncbi:Uncharacterized conserved protein [Phaffia rhodozyma]|uniref:histone acetyltransferase n=1 Tax=Phaffia rhodozyma TaxID=264483 RepID=A0A0F7SNZ3_PHARH|nr:Uncharacterized conserved protein [Phaffia rhodozyma]